MNKPLNTPDIPLYKNQLKSKDYKNQLQTIFQYLKRNVATASMVSNVTGISQKNICRYKRDLEKAGKLWEIKKTRCKITGFQAWYLTTNPNRVSKGCLSIQLNLF